MKRLIASLLAAVMLLSLCACHRPASGSLPSSSSTPSSNTDSSSEPSSSDESSSKIDSSVAGPSSSQQGDPPSEVPETIPPTTEPVSPHSEHYCYGGLTTRQKTYYDSMHTAVENMQSGWIVLGEAGDNFRHDIAVVRSALANDHPEIFWIPSYYGTATGSDGQGGTAALMLFSVDGNIDDSDDHKFYICSRGDKETMAAELADAVKKIKSKVTATDPYEIELQLHDLLCEAVTYSDDKTDPYIYTAYGALVNGKALCEGYSRAMQLLLGEFDIKSALVTGEANNEGHMWNVVELEGKWYHLDVTWNDMATGGISHAYFNLADGVIKLDHKPNEDYTRFAPGELETGTLPFNINVPVCDSTDKNYFQKTGFIYDITKPEMLAEYFMLAQTDRIEIGFATLADKNTFEKDQQKHITTLLNAIEAAEPDIEIEIEWMLVSTALRLHIKTGDTLTGDPDTTIEKNANE